ncbi:MAG: YfiR/HmsC family protein [Candidatus Latescibacteria bacterium]|nr:YfiR/HmsC family protein [Candidatus Latescibacterota bacterium]
MSSNHTHTHSLAEGPILRFRQAIRRLVVLCACSLVVVPGVRAQEMPVPVPIQAALFTKILAFDRSLPPTDPEGLVVAVLYQEKVRSSVNAKDEWIEAIESIGSDGRLEASCLPIDITDPNVLRASLTNRGIHAIYVTPLRAVEIREITAASRSLKIRTFTGVPEYVGAGIGVGIGMKGERPEILINLDASKAEGTDFRARLLKLARIVR